MKQNIRKITAWMMAASLALSLTPAFAAPAVAAGLEKAKAAVLNDAGLTPSQVVFTKARLEKEDGVDVYKVEFYHGQTEYEYELSVKDLSILEKDMDIENFTAPTPLKDGETTVTPEVALLIALNDAGVTQAEVKFLKQSMDTDDGVPYFEVDFTVGKYEYEYEISAVDGTIVEKSMESADND